jgi:error-prone DNA polymerase
VRVLPVEVSHSEWDCRLEADPESATKDRLAIRLGFCIVAGFDKDSAERIVSARREHRFTSIEDFVARSGLDTRKRSALVKADALHSLAGDRHRSGWCMQGIETLPGFLAGHSATEPAMALRAPREGEDILADYRSTGLTLRRHPLALLSPRLQKLRVRTARELIAIDDGTPVRIAGIVLHRQRPPTAKGTLFMTLEDETGCHNLIVRSDVVEAQRSVILGGRLLLVAARLQKTEGVTQLVASQFRDATRWIGQLAVASRDFR